MLTEGIISKEERDRFIKLAERLPELSAEEVMALTVEMPFEDVKENTRNQKGIF